jgi:hypothetical protein
VKPQKIDDFTEKFNAFLRRRKLSEKRVIRHFGISSATFERWKTGISQPHPSLREFVLRDLENM